jgi:hypothetical protein
MNVLTIKKRPMQEHIGGIQDIIFHTRDKALSRFFEMTDELGYEVGITYQGNLVTYEAGGRGHDYRVELELTNVHP